MPHCHYAYQIKYYLHTGKPGTTVCKTKSLLGFKSLIAHINAVPDFKFAYLPWYIRSKFQHGARTCDSKTPHTALVVLGTWARLFWRCSSCP